MSNGFDLSGKHVLVTGASSGLGRHFAGVLAAAGARVTLGARRAQALADTVESLGAERAHGVVMDVTDPMGVERAFDGAEERFGPVTVAIANAGVTATRAAIDVDEKTWDQVIDTNLKGVWLAAQAVARRMIRHGTGGSIVTIASILGLRVAGGVAPYAISKAGVHQEPRSRVGPSRDQGQRAGARLHRDRAQRRLLRDRSGNGARQADSPAPPGRRRRAGRPAAAPRIRRELVHDG